MRRNDESILLFMVYIRSCLAQLTTGDLKPTI